MLLSRNILLHKQVVTEIVDLKYPMCPSVFPVSFVVGGFCGVDFPRSRHQDKDDRLPSDK